MNVLSVCSGAGGMDLGFHRAGHRTIGLCEWDEWRRRLLAARFPGVPVHPDLRELADWCEQDPDAVREWLGGQPDVLIGGTPCQDLSVAGQRAGLDGERSGLYFDYQRVRIALGIEWAVWENVAGALSSNDGLDFASVLAAFVGADVPVPAGGWPGAGVAAGPWGGAVWRVLDAQYFGVPQRRRRVFVVGRAGGACPPEVLLERSGSAGHPAAGGRARARVAAPLTRGSSGPGVSEPGRRQEDDVNLVAGVDYTGALQAKSPESGGWRIGADEAAAGQLIAPAIVKRYAKGTDSDATDAMVVTHTLRAEGFDASEDGTGRGTPLTVVGDPLGRRDAKAGPHGAQPDQAGGVGIDGDAQRGDGRLDGAPADPDGVRAPDGLAGRLDVAAFDAYNHATSDISQTIPGAGRRATSFSMVAASFAENQRGELLENDTAGSLKGGGGKPGQGYPAVRIEGEPAKGDRCAHDPQPDGRRYAACGDGVVAPVAEWIARRLTEHGAARAA